MLKSDTNHSFFYFIFAYMQPDTLLVTSGVSFMFYSTRTRLHFQLDLSDQYFPTFIVYLNFSLYTTFSANYKQQQKLSIVHTVGYWVYEYLY